AKLKADGYGLEYWEARLNRGAPEEAVNGAMMRGATLSRSRFMQATRRAGFTMCRSSGRSGSTAVRRMSWRSRNSGRGYGIYLFAIRAQAAGRRTACAAVALMVMRVRFLRMAGHHDLGRAHSALPRVGRGTLQSATHPANRSTKHASP